tara:strand:+ start:28148 stop:28981 length:834 start_codon:yes stop_codon:yes gene_type:complete
MGFMSKFFSKFLSLNIAEKIISVNIFLFALPLFLYIFFYLFKIPQTNFYYYFELLPNITDILFRPWSLITYGFIHASIGHLFWNMILFYYFSKLFLNLFKEGDLLTLFLLGIIGGGLFFVFSYSFFPVFGGVSYPLVGSSAGVISVVIFMSTYSPNSILRIFFFNVKLVYVGIALVIFDLAQLPNSNSGGHIAHLGGALIGFFSGTRMKNGINIFSYLKMNNSSYQKIRNNQEKVSNENLKNNNQRKIDRILDKISESGYDSLTREEKRLLNEASKD